MTVHEQFAEDLALYALGSLEGNERASLEKHLEECASCRRELEQLRGDAALLALTTSGPKPPARSKARLMNAIADEPRSARVKTSRTPLWGALGWLTTAAMLILAAVLWWSNMRLSFNNQRLAAELRTQKSQSEEAKRIADLLKAPDAASFVVLPVKYPAPPPEGKAIYSRQRNGLIFIASNLKPLPPQKAYELWLIPKEGAPIPAGVFKPDAKGSATVVNPPNIPAGVEAKAFAITIEPEQGSQTPTMPIVMMGAGG